MRPFCLLLGFLAATSAAAQVANTSYTLPNGDRVLRQEAVVKASAAEAWAAWTTPEKMRGFVAPVIALDLKIGGDWEAAYNPDAKIGQPGHIHNEILAYVPGRMLTIRIRETPAGFPSPEVAKSVWTVLTFDDLGGGYARLTIEMLSWKAGPEWDRLYQFFERGNAITLERTQGYFIKGPVDWRAQSK
jgi:uncharacterized protein YndB with AHSA1/START domain